MDYFDWVLTQLEIADILYTTRTPTDYLYLGVGVSRGEEAIVYSINENSKRVSRSLLNGCHEEYIATGIFPTKPWCIQNFPVEMNDGGCNYHVLSFILTMYQQPNP